MISRTTLAYLVKLEDTILFGLAVGLTREHSDEIIASALAASQSSGIRPSWDRIRDTMLEEANSRAS